MSDSKRFQRNYNSQDFKKYELSADKKTPPSENSTECSQVSYQSSLNPSTAYTDDYCEFCSSSDCCRQHHAPLPACNHPQMMHHPQIVHHQPSFVSQPVFAPQPVMQQPVFSQPLFQQPIIQQPFLQQPFMQQQMPQQVIHQHHVVQQPMMSHQIVQQPIMHQPSYAMSPHSRPHGRQVCHARPQRPPYSQGARPTPVAGTKNPTPPPAQSPRQERRFQHPINRGYSNPKQQPSNRSYATQNVLPQAYRTKPITKVPKLQVPKPPAMKSVPSTWSETRRKVYTKKRSEKSRHSKPRRSSVSEGSSFENNKDNFNEVDEAMDKIKSALKHNNKYFKRELRSRNNSKSRENSSKNKYLRNVNFSSNECFFQPKKQDKVSRCSNKVSFEDTNRYDNYRRNTPKISSRSRTRGNRKSRSQSKCRSRCDQKNRQKSSLRSQSIDTKHTKSSNKRLQKSISSDFKSSSEVSSSSSETEKESSKEQEEKPRRNNAYSVESISDNCSNDSSDEKSQNRGRSFSRRSHTFSYSKITSKTPVSTRKSTEQKSWEQKRVSSSEKSDNTLDDLAEKYMLLKKTIQEKEKLYGKDYYKHKKYNDPYNLLPFEKSKPCSDERQNDKKVKHTQMQSSLSNIYIDFIKDQMKASPFEIKNDFDLSNRISEVFKKNDNHVKKSVLKNIKEKLESKKSKEKFTFANESPKSKRVNLTSLTQIVERLSVSSTNEGSNSKNLPTELRKVFSKISKISTATSVSAVQMFAKTIETVESKMSFANFSCEELLREIDSIPTLSIKSSVKYPNENQVTLEESKRAVKCKLFRSEHLIKKQSLSNDNLSKSSSCSAIQKKKTNTGDNQNKRKEINKMKNLSAVEGHDETKVRSMQFLKKVKSLCSKKKLKSEIKRNK